MGKVSIEDLRARYARMQAVREHYEWKAMRYSR